MASAMPSPARRIGTSPSRSPRHWAGHSASGVVTVQGSRRRSRVASKKSIWASSRTARGNAGGPVARSRSGPRRSSSSGCWDTWRFVLLTMIQSGAAMTCGTNCRSGLLTRPDGSGGPSYRQDLRQHDLLDADGGEGLRVSLESAIVLATTVALDVGLDPRQLDDLGKHAGAGDDGLADL